MSEKKQFPIFGVITAAFSFISGLFKFIPTPEERMQKRELNKEAITERADTRATKADLAQLKALSNAISRLENKIQRFTKRGKPTEALQKELEILNTKLNKLQE